MPAELLRPTLNDEIASLLDAPFRFRRRPRPLPANDRFAYRVTVLLLLLRDCSRQKKSTLKRLHFLDWAVRHEGRAQSVTRMKSLADINAAIIRYDPLVDAALRLAAAEKLVTIGSGRLTLSERGETFLASVDADDTLFEAEKRTMKTLGKHVPEKWF